MGCCCSVGNKPTHDNIVYVETQQLICPHHLVTIPHNHLFPPSLASSHPPNILAMHFSRLGGCLSCVCHIPTDQRLCFLHQPVPSFECPLIGTRMVLELLCKAHQLVRERVLQHSVCGESCLGGFGEHSTPSVGVVGGSGRVGGGVGMPRARGRISAVCGKKASQVLIICTHLYT